MLNDPRRVYLFRRLIRLRCRALTVVLTRAGALSALSAKQDKTGAGEPDTQ